MTPSEGFQGININTQCARKNLVTIKVQPQQCKMEDELIAK